MESWASQCDEKLKIAVDNVRMTMRAKARAVNIENIANNANNGGGNGDSNATPNNAFSTTSTSAFNAANALSTSYPKVGNNGTSSNSGGHARGGNGPSFMSPAGHAYQIREQEAIEGLEEGVMSHEMIQERLHSAQAELHMALTRAEEDEKERNNLWLQVQQSQREQDRLERVIQDIRHRGGREGGRDGGESIRDRESVFGGVEGGGVGGEEMARLSERLMLAEQTAMQLSARAAKSFAQSARTIAYLEGECGRFKSLVNHFRVVNEKIMCDLKIARKEGSNQRSLEHRLRLTSESENALQEDLKRLEIMVKNKERDTMLTLQQTREMSDIEYEKLQDKLTKSQENIKILNEKLVVTGKEVLQLKENIENEEMNKENEGRRMQERIDSTEGSLLDLSGKAKENEVINKSLRAVLREKENVILDLQNSLTQKQQEMVMITADVQRKALQYKEDTGEYVARVKLLELAAMKSRWV